MWDIESSAIKDQGGENIDNVEAFRMKLIAQASAELERLESLIVDAQNTLNGLTERLQDVKEIIRILEGPTRDEVHAP